MAFDRCYIVFFSVFYCMTEEEVTYLFLVAWFYANINNKDR